MSTKWTRREVIKGAGVTLATMAAPTWLTGCGGDAPPPGCDPRDHPIPSDLPEYQYSGTPGPETMFEHGVVSGDPTATAVILWTLVAPSSANEADVFWEVALDTAFRRRVAAGTFRTSVARDFTVKVDATGLRPAVTYYYRFQCEGRVSPVGRTRTAPEGPTSRLRFAVTSCSSYAHGYFHAYSRMAAREDLDAVIHLGDYIYEYGTGEYGNVRSYDPPNECVTLADYRRRYRHYRKDTQLQAVHRQHPFICVWDDHEVADNSYDSGAENHMPGSEGAFSTRLAAAKQAYAEFMPLRDQVPGSIYRKLAFGDLVDLVMLDTRNEARSKQLAPGEPDSASRTLLGTTQEAWVEATLAASTARWVVLGQQVMMAQFSADSISHAPSNADQWDGYPDARTRMFDAIEAHATGRTVVLAGDIHSSWCANLARDPWGGAYDATSGAGALAVEFVTPGVTSPGFAESPTGEDFFGGLVLDACPHIRWGNFTRRGYFVLDVRPDKIQADYYHLSSVTEPLGVTESHVASQAVMHGEPRLLAMDGPEIAPASCALAP